MFNKRVGPKYRKRIRNLHQYKDLSDEEFNAIWDRREAGIDTQKDFEDRIQSKIDSFGNDYDLSGLMINDLLTLRNLAQAYINLEDLEHLAYQKRLAGLDNLDTLVHMEKLGAMMSSLRKDISSMQADLKITRKARQGDQEASVLSELETLKSKAKEFYKERMFYVWCPKCKMLLFTGWFHYPDSPNNKIQLICNRIIDDDTKEICGNKIQLSSKELAERRGVNIEDVPEYFK